MRIWLGVFGVLTNATGGLLQNNLSDAFAVPQYVTQNAQILSKQIAVCMVAVAELDMQSSPNGVAISMQSRALNVTSKKSKKSHPCKKKKNAVPLQSGKQIAFDCCFHMPLPFPSSLWTCIQGGCMTLHPLPKHIKGYFACLNNAKRALASQGGCKNSPTSVMHIHIPDPINPNSPGGPDPFDRNGSDDDDED